MSQRDLRAFERLRQKLEQVPLQSEQQTLIDEFLSSVSSSVPLKASHQAMLLYRGRSGQAIYTTGDWNGYNEPGQKLTEIAHSGLYFLPLEVDDPASRIDYVFFVNPHKTSEPKPRLDPLNPLVVPGGLGPKSVLAMPAYKAPREVRDERPVPQGQLSRFRLRSKAMGQQRTIFVYTPPDYPKHAPYPAIYLHDGGDYIKFAHLPTLADRLIAARRTPPFVAVCIPPREREVEYDCNDAYVNFVSNEVVSAVERRFAVDARPQRRAVMGPSFGGLISLYIGLHRSDVFGMVGGQSSYASRKNSAIVKAYARAPRLSLRFHLIVGTFEQRFEPDEGEDNFLTANRQLAATLRKRKYDVNYAEYPEGHSWGLWQAHIGDALEYFFKPMDDGRRLTADH